MKKRLIVTLLAVTLAVALVAFLAVSCGDSDGGEPGTDTTVANDGRVPISGVSADAEQVSGEDTGQTYTGDNALVLSLGMPSAASLYKTFVNPWMEEVESTSGGRIEITDYSSNTLVKEEAQLRALDNGTSDILVFQIGWAPTVFPLMELGDMPMLFPNSEVAARTMWKLIDEYGPEELQDYHVLGIMMIAPAQYGGYQPVRSVADFAGKKVRSGSSVETDIIRALGATPFPAGTDYVGTQVQQKRFDGLFFTWSFHAGNTSEYLPYYTKSDMFVRTMLMMMTKEKWDSLPADVQKVLSDASGLEKSVQYLNDDDSFNFDNALFPQLGGKGDDYQKLLKSSARLKGGIYELTEAERAEWKAAVQPVIDDWVTDYAGRMPSQAILDRARELIEEYSAGVTTTTAGQ